MSSRVVRYRDIADDLRNRIEGDEFGLGDLLPSESELGSAYSASRVTVRKSLELLREAGLVDSRQGFGWFRATDPLSQSLSRLSTIDWLRLQVSRSSLGSGRPNAFVPPRRRAQAPRSLLQFIPSASPVSSQPVTAG